MPSTIEAGFSPASDAHQILSRVTFFVKFELYGTANCCFELPVGPVAVAVSFIKIL